MSTPRRLLGHCVLLLLWLSTSHAGFVSYRLGDRPAPDRIGAVEKANKITLEAAELYKKGEFEDALQLYVDALEEARPGGDVSVAIATENLGISFLSLHMISVALKKFDEALTIYKNKKGTESQESGRVFTLFAETYAQESVFDKALPFAISALSIKKEVYPEGDREVIRAMFLVSACQLGLKANDKAENWAKMAVDLAKKHLPKGDDDLVLAISNLGAVKEEAGDLPAALKLYKEALPLARKSSKTGYNSPLWVVLNNIGGYYRLKNDYEAARDVYAELVTMSRNDPAVPVTGLLQQLNNLAGCYAALNDVPAAKAVLIEVVDITENQLRQEAKAEADDETPEKYRRSKNQSPLYAPYMNLAQAYHRDGELEKAIELYTVAAEKVATGGMRGRAESSNPLRQMGIAYRALGDIPKARKYIRKAIAVLKEFVPEENEDLKNTVKMLEELGPGSDEQDSDSDSDSDSAVEEGEEDALDGGDGADDGGKEEL